jgi:hypothetical protein
MMMIAAHTEMLEQVEHMTHQNTEVKLMFDMIYLTEIG